MPAYRFYLFNTAQHITSAQDHDLPDDDAATAKAWQVLRQTEEVQVVETWERDRLVCRVAR